MGFNNHGDILHLASRLEARQLFTTPGQATGFAIGLKLFGEAMRKHREHPLFTELRPAFGEFMKRLEGGAPPADAAAG